MLIAIRLLLAMTLLTGVVYPLAVTAMAQFFFAHHASGSLIRVDNRIVGSELLAQKFTSPRYFWPRPSAADYATVPSGASNLGRSSAQLKEVVEQRRTQLADTSGASSPAELLFASASGLDPHISSAAAYFQVDRVAAARGFGAAQRQALWALIDRLSENPLLGFLGERRVNVLRLNIELDKVR